MRTVRIGAGAGFAGDRIEPALALMDQGDIQYIVFECLAERTIALAQQRKARNPNEGYNELLAYRMSRVLPRCVEKQVKVITNMGAANPVAALRETKRIATSLGLTSLKLAAVLGDDIFPRIDRYLASPLLETGQSLQTLQPCLLSANAYVGAQGIVQALQHGADVVITGRVADPALVLGPLLFEFGWDPDNADLLGKGTLVGHLLECGAQITGGYYADPGYKDVPDLANLGFPIAEVAENGDVIVTKLAGTGGMVTPGTVKEQLIYEIHDPSSYLTPDVIADFSQVTVKELAPDRVQVSGAQGKARSGSYKASVGYQGGYLVEAEISYGGSGAYERAQLARTIVEQRLERLQVPVQELRFDHIGVNSLYKDALSRAITEYWRSGPEVRLRVAARTATRGAAELVGNEVESLYTNGPAGGGGVRVHVTEVVAIGSILVPAADIQLSVVYDEV